MSVKKKKRKKRKGKFSLDDGILKIFSSNTQPKNEKFIVGNLPSDELGGLMLSVVFGKPETPRRYVAQRADGQAGGPEEQQASKPSSKLLTP